MSNITETRIANRALQRCGAQRIGLLNTSDTIWTEDSKNADEVRSCYHILRRAELRRNVWRFSIRRVGLRAIDVNSKQATFPAWAIATTYGLNDIVLGSDGQIWQSRAAGNLAHDPTVPNYTYWGLYFSPMIATEYVGAYDSGSTYAAADHTVGSNGTVYVSLSAANIAHDPVSDGGVHWGVSSAQTPTDTTAATATSFYSGELVFLGSKVYLSLQNSNTDAPAGSAKWKTVSATLALPNIIYPVGCGPFSDVATRNIFQLPNGYLREAPQAPKAGSSSFLGAPSGLSYTDWEYGDNYLLTMDPGPLIYRFAADVADPMGFDPLFVEGFSCRIALEVCEPLTQSGEKLKNIAGEYKKFMGEARAVNAIEEGPTEPPIDDYINCRQ